MATVKLKGSAAQAYPDAAYWVSEEPGLASWVGLNKYGERLDYKYVGVFILTSFLKGEAEAVTPVFEQRVPWPRFFLSDPHYIMFDGPDSKGHIINKSNLDRPENNSIMTYNQVMAEKKEILTNEVLGQSRLRLIGLFSV